MKYFKEFSIPLFLILGLVLGLGVLSTSSSVIAQMVEPESKDGQGSQEATEPKEISDGGEEDEGDRDPAAKKKKKGPEKVRITLQSGVDKVMQLDFDPLPQVPNAIVAGNPKVVRPVFVDGRRELVLKPGAKGEANVTVRDVEGNIRIIYHVVVTPTNLGKLAREIKEILRDVEGIVVKQVGEKIFLDGEIYVPQDMNRVVAITKNYTDVINITTFSPVAQKIIAQKIQKDVTEQLGLDEVRVRAINCRFFLEGVTNSYEEEQRAIEIATTYAPDIVVSQAVAAKAIVERSGKCGIVSFVTQKDQPPPKPAKMIKVVTQFVELSKDYTNFFGFKWQPGIAVGGNINVGTGTQGGLASVVNAITGTIDNLIPKLNKAKSSGKARVLENAVGVTESGQEMLIQKTTSFPFTSSSTGGQQQVVTINYGMTASIRPQIVGGENSEDVKLGVNFSLSVPAGTAANGAPKVTRNTVRNVITVKHNQSAAIAGIVRNGSIWSYNKDRSPGPNNPIFTFLRSREFITDKSQFVVFITPIIVEDASRGTAAIKKKFRVK